MTPNRSLELSVRIQDTMCRDILQFIEPIFPVDVIREYQPKSSVRRRDRVYNAENTLLTMVVTAMQEDRSLQNSVNIFQEIFRRNRLETDSEKLAELHDSVPEEQECSDLRDCSPKETAAPGKVKNVSSNTAAFSKARGRVEQELIDEVFKASARRPEIKGVSKWYGRHVFNTDGTYFQMQDTEQIPSKYRTQKNQDGTPQGYPQGLLQVLTQHGSGLIRAYRIAGRDISELDVLSGMLEELPTESLVLADDLYNCYTLFCLIKERNIDIIVPDKKNRSYSVVKQIAPGDEIVKISKSHNKIRLLLPEQSPPPPYILMRRISYRDSEHPEETRAILTTMFDESIQRHEFIEKYRTRWDIEISIRETKTLMGINIARSKSEEMVFREFGVALTAYNLVRTIVGKSAEQAPFPPETDLFQKLYSAHTSPLVDRKGRVYARWSPGRPSRNNRKTSSPQNQKQTR